MTHTVKQTEYKVLWNRIDQIRDLIGLIQDDCSKWNLNYSFQEINERIEEMVDEVEQEVQNSWLEEEN
tara:strand:+ start:304 stop:507 length:204 start_codon:yes stop_codon:yes gene_type:complete